MYTAAYTSRFKKDTKKAQKDSQRNKETLKEVMDTLLRGDTLAAKYKEHTLIGNYKGRQECHLASDWLLIFSINLELKEVLFERLGSHSELFG